MKKLTDDEQGILYRALLRHAVFLERAASQCVGSLYPSIYLGEAERTRELYHKLTGEELPVSQKGATNGKLA